jgi:hypothetical protein
VIDPNIVRMKPTRSHRRGRPAACVLSLLACLTAASLVLPGAATATGGRSLAGRAIVPVVAEAGGASLHERQKGARVRIFGPGRNGARRVVGSGRTGSAGVALVVLHQRRAPRKMLVVVGRGRLLGKRFGGHMKTRVVSSSTHTVFVSPVSTLVVQYMADHPHASLAAARRAVRRSLGIPGFFDFSGDLADRRLFDGRSFVRRARGHGGFDRFVRRRARHLGKASAGASSLVSQSCWREAAQTTAGFAELMGFTGVPSPPSLPACGEGAAGASALDAVAHASGIPGLEVFGVLTSVASLIYGVASGQSTAAQLAEIQKQLNEVQAELQEIQAELGGLQTAVAEVKAGVIGGTESTLIGEAAPTIHQIKDAGDETMALVGAMYQVLCKPGQGCTEPEESKNLGQALKKACKKNKSEECKAYQRQLEVTVRDLQGSKPRLAVEDLGSWADGSAVGGVEDAGIVQWSLQQGAAGEQFFKTANAADARLQWAYYTLYSAYAQTTLATVLSLGIGQTNPNSLASKPAKITPEIVREEVDRLNKPIGLQMTVFPNMPDTAVIDTNVETTEPPYMFPQQVGALASANAYGVGAEYAISQSSVAEGTIRSPKQSGVYLSTLQTGGEPPVVMTPAAESGETWELLPKGGGRSRPPAITTATFPDWEVAGAAKPALLPDWNAGTLKVEPDQAPLTGPLPDLYGGAKTAAGDTRGQWMTETSGIRSTLLTPAGSGYGTKLSGILPYYGKSGTDSKDPGLDFQSCVPEGDEECLLPTWQSVAVDPYDQVTSGQTYNSGSGQINTGLFDFNSGVAIANQQGHQKNESRGYYEEYPSNPSAFLNQYPNWSESVELRGVRFFGFLNAINGGETTGLLEGPSVSTKGRPVLFDRQQDANDCFYWSPSGNGNAAYGSGCLRRREHSGEILP